jgi:hypothetical protein
MNFAHVGRDATRNSSGHMEGWEVHGCWQRECPEGLDGASA